ncbi:ribose 5-phosphate isomerase A [Candidatus Methylopumilus universalis]|uniref:Ribose 5-phosphate isomerase A n=1 Tax=Candidatus Methylopumilus universalis TaxID=2588536 RepID=A0AAX1EZA1_9PROT|nr:ribose 5-phosphate isomerase A [Candidatus Methylopumilus universalis]QDC41036.1 ribose 5-phosphate isomerase A [Candidatus Methylopumilus universalis]QDC42327.1 ribose 5-phosphate isomerase A [Candidatus Methylopumilus universalis]QDC54713.1 ribose 5-phosphate isomerase A [Candidatus Methylopumilus universalis]QDC55993.1 ribose 5-phosphate isomerase A [Candidatus Methylopumilus universalis]QDC57276.1 ribose 5-phosphate isomerase A [Candidatus Methylopumilus universalis]
MNDKELVAQQALQYVSENMILGLGTGSTANCFIDALAKRNKEEKLNIRTVSSSVVSMIKAKEAGLPIIAMEQINEIDLYIDGADEITPDLTLLKGRGYDLVREKLLARSAKKFIVIADESKIVENIGDNFPVPSEVQPFAWELVKNILMKKGTGDIRINSAKDGYAITSCGNFVLDFNYTEKNIEKLNALLCQTPGIVEHGIFYNIAHGALISSNGKVREIWKN